MQHTQTTTDCDPNNKLTEQHSLSVEILSTDAQLYKQLQVCNGCWTMKVTQGHWNSNYLTGHTSLSTSDLQ